MFNAYEVSIRLKLANGISAGLGVIAGELGVFNRHVGKAQVGLDGLHSKLTNIRNLAMTGGVMAGAGIVMLNLFKVPLEDATKWERIWASMKQKGLGDAQIADAEKFVRANDIYGVSLVERAKIFNEAQGSFRESGMPGLAALDAAKTMTPVLAGYKVAMATLSDSTKAAAEGSFTQLNKIVELMGGLGDTKRATDIVGGVFKAVQGSGKMVSERDIRQFITQGGSAVSSLPLRTIFGALEPQMGEFGGSQMGTGMNTAWRLLSGTQSKPSKLFVREALKMGLWDQHKLVFNSQGGIKQYNGQPLNPAISNVMQTDTLGFVKSLMSIYASHGITSRADREHENDILLGRTGAKIYNKFMQQLATMESSMEAYDGAHTPTQVNGDQSNSIMQKSLELHKQWDDAMLNLGLIAMPLAIKGTTWLTDTIKSINTFSTEHPGAVRAMTLGFIGLAGALTFGGSVMIISAGLRGIGLALGSGAFPIIFRVVSGLTGIGGGISAISGATGLATLGTMLGSVAAGIGILFGVTKLMAAAIEAADPDTDELNHPGQRRERRRGKADVWVVDPTLSQVHAGQHFQRGGRGGSWVKDAVASKAEKKDDDYDVPDWLSNMFGGSVVKNAVAPRGRSTNMINNTIVMPDGRVLANVVTKEQAKEASRPQTGSGSFNNQMTPTQPGTTR